MCEEGSAALTMLVRLIKLMGNIAGQLPQYTQGQIFKYLACVARGVVEIFAKKV